MTDMGFPPRVSVERQHRDALTGALRWRGINPTANKLIEPFVDDEYLSLAEHNHEMAALREERDEWERIANEWLRNYDELKEKYEPMVAVTSEALADTDSEENP